MAVLLLRLAGPMQSWGDSSRFTTRSTRREPTKSGVLGLLAAALGRPRTAEIADLAGLRFGVRVDQPGKVMVDFQTAQDERGRSMPLSYRHFLSDAVFLAAVEGDGSLISDLMSALDAPGFPLFLGRRGYPASLPISLGTVDGPFQEALSAAPWQAAEWFQERQARRLREPRVTLDLIVDAEPDEVGEAVRDVPLSFDPTHRRYGWRDVVRSRVEVKNPKHKPADGEEKPKRPDLGSEPDWIAAVGGSDVSL